ncbi:L,D-transpeptidase family protein [Candidatus Coxiella mudrowiae]|uniref:L,D-transpeptidase family protein n=1 Tax=Candidatus Coxiella mudrowiae TaxID=2054173 RepID=UPI001FD3B1A5|nr:L,D-transpeptidase [Candidatus Coxiella mudrowiae]
MFFKEAILIHGSPYISNRNTSHRCIRVYPSTAAWLSKYLMRLGTKVIVLP